MKNVLGIRTIAALVLAVALPAAANASLIDHDVYSRLSHSDAQAEALSQLSQPLDTQSVSYNGEARSVTVSDNEGHSAAADKSLAQIASQTSVATHFDSHYDEQNSLGHSSSW
ncbi:hypothetical protein [Phytohalomonas tamaricis]|uniref:hypothetical protein n=1 Tax=Phytohalomonas tamaricis TaxID=2081032 RepID=UPI000D0B7A89|nr:hypothetical protein [Phytohalomonas tamaricis]